MSAMDERLRRGDMSAFVADFAVERGISERTAWRWVARARREGFLPERNRSCEQCDDPLPEGATRRRRFCRAACRVKWNRRPDRPPPARPARIFEPIPRINPRLRRKLERKRQREREEEAARALAGRLKEVLEDSGEKGGDGEQGEDDSTTRSPLVSRRVWRNGGKA